MREIWKPVPGYEGLYEVSNLGRVKSLRRNIILKPNRVKDGYIQVHFCTNGKKGNVSVHRIVAEVFCEKPEGKDVVDHINGIPNDNRAANLRWVTQKENVHFGRMVIRPVVRSDGKVYESVISTEEDGFLHKNVIKCCQGKRKTHHGYGWRYAM